LHEYPAVIKAGYEGMELIVSDFFVPDQPDSDFQVNLGLMKQLNANLVSCMQFIPARLKMVGPKAQHDEIMVWAETTFRRAQMAGVPYIVLGSGESRRVPDGFDFQEATQQIIDLCKRMAPVAQKYGVYILVEPLARIYTNFIFTLAEGAAVVEAVNHPNVQLLCDIYHMLREDDPAEDIVKYGKYILHCHIAEKENRTAPGTVGDDFRPYFNALKQINYRGAISVEIEYVDGKYEWDDFEKQIAASLQYMKKQCKQAN
jgi:sugar phosphate isomerase/epimerase